MRSRFSLAFVVAVAVAALGGDAFAIVGRPLTPVSYAGVARRTVRRTAYAAPVAVGAAAVGTAAAVAAHPSPYYTRPAFYGGTVVYVH